MVKAMHVSQDHFLVSDAKKNSIVTQRFFFLLEDVEFPLLGY
jgi:hypothetical protein